MALSCVSGFKGAPVLPTPAIRTAFPRDVREIEHIWIPMPDGTRLAARIWLPADAQTNSRPGHS